MPLASTAAVFSNVWASGFPCWQPLGQMQATGDDFSGEICYTWKPSVGVTSAQCRLRLVIYTHNSRMQCFCKDLTVHLHFHYVMGASLHGFIYAGQGKKHILDGKTKCSHRRLACWTGVKIILSVLAEAEYFMRVGRTWRIWSSFRLGLISWSRLTFFICIWMSFTGCDPVIHNITCCSNSIERHL